MSNSTVMCLTNPVQDARSVWRQYRSCSCSSHLVCEERGGGEIIVSAWMLNGSSSVKLRSFLKPFKSSRTSTVTCVSLLKAFRLPIGPLGHVWALLHFIPNSKVVVSLSFSMVKGRIAPTFKLSPTSYMNYRVSLQELSGSQRIWVHSIDAWIVALHVPRTAPEH